MNKFKVRLCGTACLRRNPDGATHPSRQGWHEAADAMLGAVTERVAVAAVANCTIHINFN